MGLPDPIRLHESLTLNILQTLINKTFHKKGPKDCKLWALCKCLYWTEQCNVSEAGHIKLISHSTLQTLQGSIYNIL